MTRIACYLPALAILCGYQSILFAIFTKTFAISEGLMPEDPVMARFFKLVNLERGLIIASVALLLLGLALLRGCGFSLEIRSTSDSLDYAHTMRWVIPGAGHVLGFQTVLSDFFVSILGMHRR